MLIKDENHGKLFLRINLISVLGALLTPMVELPGACHRESRTLNVWWRDIITGAVQCSAVLLKPLVDVTATPGLWVEMFVLECEVGESESLAGFPSVCVWLPSGADTHTRVKHLKQAQQPTNIHQTTDHTTETISTTIFLFNILQSDH